MGMHSDFLKTNAMADDDGDDGGRNTRRLIINSSIVIRCNAEYAKCKQTCRRVMYVFIAL